MTPPFAGAVLCGGASRRMGRDKAVLEVRGTPMARRVADALAAAGATSVVAVGGDATALRALGLVVVPDDVPGAGPLAAVATALRSAGRRGEADDIVLVVACDLLRPSPAAMAAVIGTLAGQPGADLAVPIAEGRRQWGHGAWRTRALPGLDAQLAAGERAIHRAVAAAGLVVAEATGLPEDDLADADTPNDLARVRDEGGHRHAH